MPWENVLFIAVGLGLLAISARETIKILVKIARHVGASEFSISFLLVGMLSVFPELVIGINSAFDSQSSFGLGIVFGSNIADLTLITGLVALFANGVKIKNESTKNIKMAMCSVVLPLLFLLDGEISRIEGVILVLVFLVYVTWIITHEKNKKIVKSKTKLVVEAPSAIIFVALMLFAGNMIMDNTILLNNELGIPIFFLGIIIAIGTCLPELVFAIESASKKHSELGIGDILGNVFADCMATIGIIAIINPIKPESPQIAIISGTIMVLCMGIVFLLFSRDNYIPKKAGVALVIVYIVFVIIQFLAERAIV